MKTLSSTAMPIALYFAALVTIVTSVVLIVNWDENNQTAAPIGFLILAFFFLYLLFCFSKFRIVKTDNSFYYLTNMLTWRIEKIDATKVTEIKNKSFLEPLTRTLTYTNDSEKKQKVWFTRKLGLL